jgi:hypothetical protein
MRIFKGAAGGFATHFRRKSRPRPMRGEGFSRSPRLETFYLLRRTNCRGPALERAKWRKNQIFCQFPQGKVSQSVFWCLHPAGLCSILLQRGIAVLPMAMPLRPFWAFPP